MHHGKHKAVNGLIVVAATLLMYSGVASAIDSAPAISQKQKTQFSFSDKKPGSGDKRFYALSGDGEASPKQGSKTASDDTENAVPNTKLPKPTSTGGEIDLPSAVADEDLGGQQVFPEITMQVNLSSSDVNRVTCKSDIRDVVYSQEKGLKVKYSGKNAFLKFLVAKQDDTVKYAKDPVEVFIICGENTYNMIAIPKRIPSQTVRLDSGKADRIQKNASIFSGQPFEKKLTSLIKSAYMEETPESYKVDIKQEEIKAFKDLEVFLRKVIQVEGEGFFLKEYLVTDKNLSAIELSEKSFLTRMFAKRPLAIVVEKPRLKKGESTRVFIVESTGEANVE